ncbi:MAG: cyanophycin synthetase [Isosphaeraceae bacterium]
MEFRKVLALRGPNIWANSPVLEAWLDLKELKDSPSNSLPGFNDRLMAWMPTLIEHECSEGHQGGFFVRLREGTWPGHILEHVALELQTLAGTPVGFGRTRETAEEGVYKVVVKYREEALGRDCLDTGLRLVLAAIHDTPFDLPAEVRRLRLLARQVGLGPTGSIVKAAQDRGIPVRRLDAEGIDESLVQLGQGARQRRILSAYTDRTSSISEGISTDKELTKVLLKAIGVPVPVGRPVADAEEAWEAACDLGVPVVVKPRDADYGNGVALHLTTKEQVVAAYAAAREKSPHVLVERFVHGKEHRLLVVGDRLAAATLREPAQVVGDGRSTIAQLVEVANLDPRRGADYERTVLRKIPLDPTSLDVLADQKFTPDSVPASGLRVMIRRNTHRLDGGTTTDVTALVHPEVAARAIDAAKVIGLDVAGLDIVAKDIGRPLEEQGGVVIEVNAGPSLLMHLKPAYGSPQPVGEAIIDSLFPNGEDGRIPLVAVTGVNGKTTTTRLVGHILKVAGYTVGMTCTDGIYVDDRRIESADCSGPRSARSALLNPRVDAAVFECARGGILREGLGFDKCSVAIVTNIGEGDHLGLNDIHTLEKLALVKRTPVDVVLPTGTAVLKADDPWVAPMADHCRGTVTFFCRDADHPVMTKHRAQGGRLVFDRDGSIILAEGAREEVLTTLDCVPLTLDGRIGFQVENVLAAAAAAWGLGIPFDTVKRALATFDSDMDQVPGRFNVIPLNGATIIADFGHNPSALLALAESLDAFPHERRVAILSADGDRPDESIIRQAQILGEAIDRIILYEEDCRNRGRGDGEIISLLRRGLAEASRTQEIEEVAGELAAIERGLQTLQPSDLLLILHDNVEASLNHVRGFLKSRASFERAAVS